MHLPIRKVNLAEKLAAFQTHWDPKIVGELNGQQVKLVKFRGEFVWHQHEREDELFLVIRGRFVMQFRGGASSGAGSRAAIHEVPLEAGEFLIVPRGVEHRPVAAEEVEVLLFEPATTLNTGNVVSERTVHAPERL